MATTGKLIYSVGSFPVSTSTSILGAVEGLGASLVFRRLPGAFCGRSSLLGSKACARLTASAPSNPRRSTAAVFAISLSSALRYWFGLLSLLAAHDR